MARRIGSAAIDSFANVLSGFFAEAFEVGDPAVLAGLFELLDRFNAEFIVQRLDFFRTYTWDFEHGDQAGRRGSPQFLVIRQLAGGAEVADFFPDGFADSFDFGQPLFGNDFVQLLA